MTCPICQSADCAPHARWPDFKTLECCKCGFRYIDTAAPDYPKNAQYVYDELGDFSINPNQPHLLRRLRDVLRFRQPPGSALDIGCGKGELSLLLSKAGFQCTGIDMKERMILHLQRHHPEVKWRCATTDELEDEGEQFDVITMYHVLEHITGPVECLKRIKHLAKPGALVLIEVPNVGGLEARLKGKKWHYYKVDHVNYFRAVDLRRIAEKVGLQVVALRGYQHFSHPQDVLWKDCIKGTLGLLGFKDVISAFFRA
jgi:2-polyprenyl-3-methyl-5-hydroxy-6-metoxy-1,4-benzoquinol methylase